MVTAINVMSLFFNASKDNKRQRKNERFRQLQEQRMLKPLIPSNIYMVFGQMLLMIIYVA